MMWSTFLQLRKFLNLGGTLRLLSEQGSVQPVSKGKVSFNTQGDRKVEEADTLSATAVLESDVDADRYSLEALKKLKFDKYPYYVEREWWKEGSRMTFWATWRMLRDVKRRQALEQYGPNRLRLKALKSNTILPQAIRDECADRLHNFPKASCPNLILNMCQFSGRQRGKIKRFRLNRHLFRKLADHGQLSGVQRAMW